MSARRPLYLKRQWQQIHELESHRVLEWMRKYDIHSLTQASIVLADPKQNSDRRVAAADILRIMGRERSFPELSKAITCDDEQLVWGGLVPCFETNG